MNKKCQHLSTEKHDRLITLLLRFEDIFGGMVGTWDTTLLYLKLKNNVKPVCSRPYPVPMVHKVVLKKEVKVIVILVVLEHANYSKRVAPYLVQPKSKTYCVLFLSDFQTLNRQLKRKSYPMPKMREIILKLEVFKLITRVFRLVRSSLVKL